MTIRIPSKLNVYIVGFFMFWLCGWAFGDVVAIKMIFSMISKQPKHSAFVIMCLCFWPFGCVGIMYHLLWQFSGCEIIKTSSTTLGIKRELFGYGGTREYDLSEVRQLRVLPWFYRGTTRGNLAFNRGFRTVRFGADVDEAEAKTILQTITDYAPLLRYADAA